MAPAVWETTVLSRSAAMSLRSLIVASAQRALRLYFEPLRLVLRRRSYRDLAAAEFVEALYAISFYVAEVALDEQLEHEDISATLRAAAGVLRSDVAESLALETLGFSLKRYAEGTEAEGTRVATHASFVSGFLYAVIRSRMEASIVPLAGDEIFRVLPYIAATAARVERVVRATKRQAS
jgi:hypothetical protein